MANHRVAAPSLTGGMHATYSVARRGLGLSGWGLADIHYLRKLQVVRLSQTVPNPLLPTIFRHAFRLSRMICHFTHTIWGRPLPEQKKARCAGRGMKRATPMGIKGGFQRVTGTRFAPARRESCIMEMVTTVKWSWREESNPRPADYKSAALPTELRQRSSSAGLHSILPATALQRA